MTVVIVYTLIVCGLIALQKNLNGLVIKRVMVIFTIQRNVDMMAEIAFKGEHHEELLIFRVIVILQVDMMVEIAPGRQIALLNSTKYEIFIVM